MLKNRKISKRIITLVVLSTFLIVSCGITAYAADTNIASLGASSTSFCSSWETLTAINDGYTPSSSGDTTHGQYGNWDNAGTTQWVQYDFTQNYTISKCEVYWFSDIASSGDIDVPASYAIKYWNGSAWTAVSNASGLGVTANQFNTTTFTSVTTTKIRLEMTAQSDHSTGILEWRVWGSSATATNTAPTVNAGTDAAVTLPSSISLTGTASDDGLPSGSTLTTAWSRQSGPGTATIASASSLSTTATVTVAGTYVFLLTATDGTLSSTDTVTITVNPAGTAIDVVAYYKFDETSGTSAADSSGNGKTATLTSATWAAGNSGNALNLSGSTQYASLPSGIVSGLTDFTIAVWVKLDTVSNWSRIFDFGTGTSKYLFITPKSSSSTVRFAIKNGGTEQVINSTAALATGVWKHVAVTMSGSTGTLYIDGAVAGTNTSMTINPSAIGATTLNYIGKSMFSSDPYLDGLVDEFKIYNRALSAAEIVTLYGGTVTNTAPTVNAGIDSSFTLPSTISLSGTATDDGLPSGSTLTKTWSLQSGPGTAAIANAGALSTTATVTVAGTYVFKLTASDGTLSASDTVTITVNATSTGPVVTTPPSWINSFYTKCVMINGIPICSTSAVPDAALQTAYYVLDAQLKKIVTDKPAVMQEMLDNDVYVIIVGLSETNSMHPSWAGYNDPSWPRRGGGGNPTTVLEEDCIVPASDTWRQNFCGLVHEFAHTLLTYGIGDAGLVGADTATYNAIVAAYNSAIAANKYTESSYDRNNYHEYFTGQSGRWFNANPTDLNVPNATSKTDRQQLQEYDPTIYNILATLYGDYLLPEPWN